MNFFALFRGDCEYIAAAAEISSRSTLRGDTWRDGAPGMTRQKLPLSLCCLRPCLRSGPVRGVNTLLSNGLLGRPEVPLTNRLMIGLCFRPTTGLHK